MNDAPWSGRRLHFVGIGGAGMSALAQILLERGHAVTGSDLRGGRAASAVEALGATVHIGHDAEHVGDTDLVVVSNAIPADNPETARARERDIPVLLRAQLLEVLMRGSRRILVSGTHGKTTTTSMVTVALQAAGLDPSFAIGGAVRDAGTSAHHGTGGIFVAEADEAYRSFLHLTGDCAVITNVEMDHHDAFADEGALHAAFEAFLARCSGAGPVVLCRDDPGATRLAAAARGEVVTYGEHADARVRVTDTAFGPDGSTFRVANDGEDLGAFRLRVLGRHNVLNAAAAVAAARWAGASAEALREGLAAFVGAQRRFQRLGDAAGIAVVDDYAHHPSEIAAALDAARQARPAGRVVAVFQPHLYSPTQAFAPGFGAALAAADVVVVTDVYGAREQPVPGVTGSLVAEAARGHGTDTHYVPLISDVPEAVAELARPGDLVLTLGAGDITEIGPVILRRLEGSA
jgi:UDP-N-acetylmuramate--alanine ligase